MADNVEASAGSGGATFATDDIGGIQYPRTKVVFGADGSATDVSSSAPLPVTLANTGANSTAVKVDGSAVTQPVSGTVTVNTLPAGDNNIGNVDIASALPAGTNAIGKLAANSGVDIGDVDVTSQPARAATTDTITAKLATDAIQNGTTALTPKFAKISASTSGNNTLIAAVTSKKIRVLAVSLMATSAVNAKFQDGAGGTDLTGLYYCAANGGFVLPFNPVGWFETSSNTLLNLNLSAANAVGGCVSYVEV